MGVHHDKLFTNTRKLKMLVIDIESSKIKAYGFRAWDKIMPKDIYGHGHFLTYAYRFFGHDMPVKARALTDFPKRFKQDPTDDYELVKEIGELINESDVVITQNGDQFDLPYIKTRLMVHGLPPIKKIVSSDTRKMMKSFFLQSRSLDYVSGLIGTGQKDKFYDKDGTWVRATEGDREAIEAIRSYNVHDIELTEQVLLKILPYVDPKWNMNLLLGTIECCVSCGSSDLHRRGYHYTKVGRRDQINCKDCGSYMSVRVSDHVSKFIKTSETY